VDLARVAGRGTGDGGVPHGAALVAFAEAALGRDAGALEQARRELLARIGPAAVVDAAAVVGAFEMMDRIADATGIPLDRALDAATQELRSDLGLERFASAANTRTPAWLRWLGRVVEPFAPRVMARLAGRRPSRSAR
jgi:hypothetical protein